MHAQFTLPVLCSELAHSLQSLSTKVRGVNTVSALLARNHLGSAVIHAKRRLGNVILFTYTCAFYFQDIALCQTPRDVQEIVLKSLCCGVNQMTKFEKEGNPAAYTGHSI